MLGQTTLVLISKVIDVGVSRLDRQHAIQVFWPIPLVLYTFFQGQIDKLTRDKQIVFKRGLNR